MAIKQDFVIDQGSDYAIKLSLRDNSTGGVKDLTSHTIAGMVKKTYTSDSDQTWPFTTVINNPPTAGNVTISLTNQQTDQMTPGRFVYDLELSFVDSDLNTIIERILEGNITITPSVTR